MKTMTCNQLGGACDEAFSAGTFDEMAELSRQHGMAMHQKQDAAHMEAMQKMMELMQDAAAMQKWMDERRAEFDALPND